jgi:hypothetical protein
MSFRYEKGATMVMVLDDVINVLHGRKTDHAQIMTARPVYRPDLKTHELRHLRVMLLGRDTIERFKSVRPETGSWFVFYGTLEESPNDPEFPLFSATDFVFDQLTTNGFKHEFIKSGFEVVACTFSDHHPRFAGRC